MTSRITEKGKELDEELSKSLKLINGSSYTNIKPTTLSISTISFVAVLNMEKLNLKYIYDRFLDNPVRQTIHTCLCRISNSEKQVMLSDNAVFSNSAIMKFEKCFKNIIAVKIFHNGVLHITGPSSVRDLISTLEMVTKILDAVYQQPPGKCIMYIYVYVCLGVFLAVCVFWS